MINRKYALLGIIVAFFGASAFCVTALGLIVCLCRTIMQTGLTSDQTPGIISDWAVALGACIAAHTILLSAAHLLWWRNAAPSPVSRNWLSDLGRVLSLDIGFSVLRFALWTCQIIASIGCIVLHKTSCAALIALSATLLLFLSLAARASLAHLWAEDYANYRGILGFFASIRDGVRTLYNRPLHALLCMICPKIAFFALGLATLLAILLQTNAFAVLLLSAGMLIARWIEPFLWFKRTNPQKNAFNDI